MQEAQPRDMAAIRRAFWTEDVDLMRAEHGKASLTTAKEQHGGVATDYIKSIVFGGLDGILTTFAVVTAAAGAQDRVSGAAVLIFGFANLFADGFAMGFGEYTSSKAEADLKQEERKREEWEFENYPEGEKQEMVDLYVQKGMTEEDAWLVVETFSKYPRVFVDLMMVEELGVIPEEYSPMMPLKQGCIMFCSFVVFGAIPLLAYVPSGGTEPAFGISCMLTALCLAGLGSIKGRLTGNAWWRSGLQMLLNGTIAAAVSYSVSMVVASLLPSGR